jgi:hypothetical protein
VITITDPSDYARAERREDNRAGSHGGTNGRRDGSVPVPQTSYVSLPAAIEIVDCLKQPSVYSL